MLCMNALEGFFKFRFPVEFQLRLIIYSKKRGFIFNRKKYQIVLRAHLLFFCTVENGI